jgi:hypothetical protein
MLMLMIGVRGCANRDACWEMLLPEACNFIVWPPEVTLKLLTTVTQTGMPFMMTLGISLG